MQDKTLEALKEISDVFKFELWLRFYFIEQQGDKLRINLDPQVLEKMGDEYGHLAELASAMNNVDLSPAVCQQVIVEHITTQFDGKKYELGYVPKILDHAAFKAELELFNAWAHLHEEQLEKTILSFDKWKELYDEWKRSENAQKMEMSLSMQNAQQVSGPSSSKTN